MGATTSRRAALCTFDDGFSTESSRVQVRTENSCMQFYLPMEGIGPKTRQSLMEAGFLSVPEDGAALPQPLLLRSATVAFLRKGLSAPLGPSYISLDASRPWLIYWMLHALTLLDAFPDDLISSIRGALKTCIGPGGLGFGGGFMQEPHTAPTYAAVLALCTLGDKESLALIDRAGVYKFFMSVKDRGCGGFRVQKDGEMDSRGLYTVLAVASLLNILTPELTEGCAEFVASCQTFEGGIGGEPGNEAHGGYAFCALASLAILNRMDAIDLDAFTEWVAQRQMRMEGGFQGRTNKLVDSCYSFWQGATSAILHKYAGVGANATAKSKVGLAAGGEDVFDDGDLLFAQTRLQQYVLLCCQFKEGGLRDKPDKNRDQYHTCYSLSGISVSQQDGKVVWGDATNKLKETDPIFNIEVGRLAQAQAYFASQPPVVPVS